ncbi:hypothetical protein NQ314_005234 [Rhamnusium bicolor]|uniref:Fas-associated factor 1/2-like UAS domain-containing protein n=1 Tax=Rhamnusium bicolor TaxID=1586634 RepID=A0AAV8ZHY9_9CUCU|nr:hypothetical protein NQ314_005234 [Rhamnusium bicolor]
MSKYFNVGLVRRVLCLYLHNESEKFSTIFCENLKRAEVAEVINRSFFFLGWDVEETKYQSALVRALSNCSDLSSLVSIVHSKIAAALLIVPIKDSITVFSCIKGKVSDKDLLTALINVEQFLIVENQQEKN